MSRWTSIVACVGVLVLGGQVLGAPWDTVVFREDFAGTDGSPPDPARWVVNHPGEWWWVQGRTLFPEPSIAAPATPTHWLPYIENNTCVFEHHLYNPFDSNHLTFLGGEIHTLPGLGFQPGSAYRFEARVRSSTSSNGLVTSFFTYGYDGAKSDEVDYEFLSNRTNQYSPNQDAVLLNSWNESSKTSDTYVWPTGLDLANWNVFRIYWYPAEHRVEWTWLDPSNGETLLHAETDPNFVPDEGMSLYFNFWAAGDIWGDAYDANLQPVSNPSLDQTFRFEVDYVEVSPEPATLALLALGGLAVLRRRLRR
jgi:hypothetical protein